MTALFLLLYFFVFLSDFRVFILSQFIYFPSCYSNFLFFLLLSVTLYLLSNVLLFSYFIFCFQACIFKMVFLFPFFLTFFLSFFKLFSFFHFFLFSFFIYFISFFCFQLLFLFLRFFFLFSFFCYLFTLFIFIHIYLFHILFHILFIFFHINLFIFIYFIHLVQFFISRFYLFFGGVAFLKSISSFFLYHPSPPHSHISFFFLLFIYSFPILFFILTDAFLSIEFFTFFFYDTSCFLCLYF